MLLRLWHASDKPRGLFAHFTHFGTYEAALKRASDKHAPFLHEVELDIDNSFEIQDCGTLNHSPKGILTELETILVYPEDHEREGYSILDFDDVDALLSEGKPKDMAVHIITKSNIDSIFYTNQHEDKGSISWVILDPARVNILSIKGPSGDIPIPQSKRSKRIRYVSPEQESGFASPSI
jgi:hypothetical protein